MASLAPEDAGDVLVVGGSLGGLAAAAALAGRGRAVTVLEARDRPLEDRWGLTLWPPGVAVLDHLGVGTELRRRGTVLDSLLWMRESGREWLGVASRDVTQEGSFVGVSPSALEQILAGAAERAGARLLHGWRVDRVETLAGEVRVRAATDDGARRLFASRVLVAADGPGSVVRRLTGVPCRRIGVPGQTVFTGIGGPLPFRQMRQALGPRWSVSALPLGPRRSWLSVCTHGGDGRELLSRYARASDPEIAPALEALDRGWTVEPANGYVPRWSVDGVVLMGEAAHPMVPHLGLGGSQTLEDVPVLAEVVDEALRTGDASSGVLERFRARRRRGIAYAQRVSLSWAWISTGSNRALRLLRDAGMWRLARHRDGFARYLRELAERGRPSLRARTIVWLP